MVASSFDSGPTLAHRMRRRAGDADHLYGHLMRAMADDWEHDGPVREIFSRCENPPMGAVVQLRLLAGLFRIVLSGRARELEGFYPCLGGTSDPSVAWPTVRPVLASHVDELQQALTVAPQTNEVGRSNALLVGILAAVERTALHQVRLLEPGCSAGLNLLVDQFRFVNGGWAFGPPASPVVLVDGVRGDVLVADVEIVARRGCDLAPVDLTTPEGRLRLRSFVWPFHIERHQRLAAALTLAERGPPVVDAATAGEWLRDQLATPGDPGVLTVVWQSITRLYWPAEEVALVSKAIEEAARRIPIAHVSMEYPTVDEDERGDELAELTLAWSVGPADPDLHRERLGTVGDHGFPVTLLS